MFHPIDVKPSNVLINKEGHVKMCDFGISGYLVDSVAKTMDAGCKPYMAVSSTTQGGRGQDRMLPWCSGQGFWTAFSVAEGPPSLCYPYPKCCVWTSTWFTSPMATIVRKVGFLRPSSGRLVRRWGLALTFTGPCLIGGGQDGTQ